MIVQPDWTHFTIDTELSNERPVIPSIESLRSGSGLQASTHEPQHTYFAKAEKHASALLNLWQISESTLPLGVTANKEMDAPRIPTSHRSNLVTLCLPIPRPPSAALVNYVRPCTFLAMSESSWKVLWHLLHSQVVP